MEEIPVFEKAVRKFEDFLVQQNKPGDILWLFQEDITMYKHQMWIKFPFFQEHTRLVREIYEIGVQRGFGINMNQIATFENYSLCYIWLPKDETEMEYALMSNCLKLVIYQSDFNVIIIRNKLKWWFLKWFNSLRRFNFLEAEFLQRKIFT